MSAATIFWIMWGLTIVGLLVVGRRHHREVQAELAEQVRSAPFRAEALGLIAPR